MDITSKKKKQECYIKLKYLYDSISVENVSNILKSYNKTGTIEPKSVGK